MKKILYLLIIIILLTASIFLVNSNLCLGQIAYCLDFGPVW